MWFCRPDRRSRRPVMLLGWSGFLRLLAHAAVRQEAALGKSYPLHQCPTCGHGILAPCESPTFASRAVPASEASMGDIDRQRILAQLKCDLPGATLPLP